MQQVFDGFGKSLTEKEARAIELLRENEPAEGYYGAFSGGKDSCTIKALAAMARVRVDWEYSNTTIDPPELVRFIKREHPDVRWNNPEHGNMLHRIATRSVMDWRERWRKGGTAR